MGMLRAMNEALVSVFGCHHGRMNRIFTIGEESYMACPDCGHRVYYSTAEMRRMTRREVRQMRRAHRPLPQRATVMAASKDPTLAA